MPSYMIGNCYQWYSFLWSHNVWTTHFLRTNIWQLFLKLQTAPHCNMSNKCKNPCKFLEAAGTTWNLLSDSTYLSSFCFSLFLNTLPHATEFSTLYCLASPHYSAKLVPNGALPFINQMSRKYHRIAISII